MQRDLTQKQKPPPPPISARIKEPFTLCGESHRKESQTFSTVIPQAYIKVSPLDNPLVLFCQLITLPFHIVLKQHKEGVIYLTFIVYDKPAKVNNFLWHFNITYENQYICRKTLAGLPSSYSINNSSVSDTGQNISPYMFTVLQIPTYLIFLQTGKLISCSHFTFLFYTWKIAYSSGQCGKD